NEWEDLPGRPIPETVTLARLMWMGLQETYDRATRAARTLVSPFDLAVILPNSPRSALEMWVARIPDRIGYSHPGRNWCLTRTVHSRPDQVRMRKRSTIEIKRLIQTRARGNNPSSGFTPQSHHIHHYLHLIAGLG